MPKRESCASILLAPRPPSRSPPTYDPHSHSLHCRVPYSRDFVHWRFSDAGRRSAWIASSCRRPKTCTTTDVATASTGPKCRRPHVLAAPTTVGTAAIVLSWIAIGDSWIAEGGSWIAVGGSRIAVVIIIICIVAAAVVRGRDSGADQSAGQCARRETPSTMPAAPAAVPSAETHLDPVTLLRHRLGSCG